MPAWDADDPGAPALHGALCLPRSCKPYPLIAAFTSISCPFTRKWAQTVLVHGYIPDRILLHGSMTGGTLSFGVPTVDPVFVENRGARNDYHAGDDESRQALFQYL